MTQRFTSVLVANRGEIAVRIIRSVQAAGLRAIAVYSDADAGAPHVQQADAVVRIGAGPVSDSYLDPERILQAAQQAGAGAIHPGYGFLSENADFATAVAAAGMVFIGPSAEAIRVMGDKAVAKVAMQAAGVPCVPGYEGGDQDEAVLLAEAENIGFPVMVKASAGGGGRGMRLVACAADLPEALQRARDEARNAFGSDHLILEKAVQRPRHVEFQIFADSHSNILHLGERDCSVQRRHQKVIEEAPCPVMTEALRAQMGAAAITAARSVNYQGAGTVEFLLDDTGAFFFLEMNTRLQVEHPVTEMVTGLDLVALQISVAQGDPLPLTQDQVQLRGHAVEVRLYAEDPGAGFLPVTGDIALWQPASGDGIRIDSGVRSGQVVPPYYDAMLAKLIAWGPDRQVAIQRLIKALEGSHLLGLDSNTAFLSELLHQPAFQQGDIDTGFIAQTYPDGPSEPQPDSAMIAVAGALALQADSAYFHRRSPLPDTGLAGFSTAAPLPACLSLQCKDQVYNLRAITGNGTGWAVSVGDVTYAVQLETVGATRATLRVDEQRHVVGFVAHPEAEIHLGLGADRFSFVRHQPWDSAADASGSGQITAPMPGQVISVNVAVGDRVAAGDTLAILEAMKMQHQLCAEISGQVTGVLVQQGQQIGAGDMMITIEEEEA